VTTYTKGTTHQAARHGVTAQMTTPQDFLLAICPNSRPFAVRRNSESTKTIHVV